MQSFFSPTAPPKEELDSFTTPESQGRLPRGGTRVSNGGVVATTSGTTLVVFNMDEDFSGAPSSKCGGIIGKKASSNKMCTKPNCTIVLFLCTLDSYLLVSLRKD